MTLNDRIQKRLTALKKSERRASLEAGLSDSFLRNIRIGKSVNPRTDTLEKIANVLKTSVNWLIHGEETEELHLKEEAKFFRKIPLYETARENHNELEIRSVLNTDIWCPTPLLHNKGVYAVIISGDSMYPRYEDGDCAFIDPSKMIKKGDYVLAKLRSEKVIEETEFYIKRFIEHTESELILEQLNPKKELRFCYKRVISLHYVALSGCFTDLA